MTDAQKKKLTAFLLCAFLEARLWEEKSVVSAARETERIIPVYRCSVELLDDHESKRKNSEASRFSFLQLPTFGECRVFRTAEGIVLETEWTSVAEGSLIHSPLSSKKRMRMMLLVA